MNIRELALNAIYKIVEEDAYSDIVIKETIEEYGLVEPDLGFYKKLVLGTVSKAIKIDRIIDKMSNIKSNRISKYVRCILRISIYQIDYMEHIPDHAVLNEANNLANRYGNRGSKAFINGILRNYIKVSKPYDMEFTDEVDRLSYEYSFNADTIRYFLKFENLNIERILQSFDLRPMFYVRFSGESEENVIGELRSLGFRVYKASYNDDFLYIENPNGIFETNLFKSGKLTVQDQSSGLVVNSVALDGCEKILDLCAAPGGKSMHFASKLINGGSVISCDVFESRLSRLKQNVERLKIDNINILKNDALILNKDFVDAFDIVLADVPCSGFGIVRRKPEIRFKTPDSIFKYAKQSALILSNASKYVKKGGLLIHSTCTIAPDENEILARDFLRNNVNFVIQRPVERLKLLCNDDGFIGVKPDMDMDGFFIAIFRRVK